MRSNQCRLSKLVTGFRCACCLQGCIISKCVTILVKIRMFTYLFPFGLDSPESFDFFIIIAIIRFLFELSLKGFQLSLFLLRRCFKLQTFLLLVNIINQYRLSQYLLFWILKILSLTLSAILKGPMWILDFIIILSFISTFHKIFVSVFLFAF